MSAVTTAAAFAGAALLGAAAVAVARSLVFVGLMPLYILSPAAFLAAGALAGAALDTQIPRAVVRMACAFGIIGIGALVPSVLGAITSSPIAHHVGLALLFVLGGWVASYPNQVDASHRRPVLAAFGVGAVVAVLTSLAWGALQRPDALERFMIAAVFGLGTTGGILAVLLNRDRARPP